MPTHEEPLNNLVNNGMPIPTSYLQDNPKPLTFEEQETRETTFRKKLEHLINCESRENDSNTPDFILADYLADCLRSYDRALQAREKWFGRPIAACCAS